MAKKTSGFGVCSSCGHHHGVIVPALIVVAGIVLLAWGLQLIDAQAAIGSAAVLIILLGVAKLSKNLNC